MPSPVSKQVSQQVAAVQMCSGSSVAENLRTVDGLLADACAQGCSVAVLPENFAFVGEHDRDKLAVAEEPGRGPVQAFLADAASRHGLWIVAGSLPLRSPDAARCYGACFAFDDRGRVAACYRKIHLFDVDLPDRPESYRESASMVPGDDPVAVETPIGRLGLTICYDIRFPELYRRLADQGATAFSVAAAFTQVTGAAHWHVLIRARAIENLAYVIAAAQQGGHPNGRLTYGHSMIVDPWGRILAEKSAGEGLAIATIEPAMPGTLRSSFPALAHRRF
jgi:deaminated glutathione amidase